MDRLVLMMILRLFTRLIQLSSISAESFCTKGKVFKGLRRHARKRCGRVEYMHCHYFVTLEEGKPPKDYYNKTITPDQQLEKWLEGMHKRKITNSL